MGSRALGRVGLGVWLLSALLTAGALLLFASNLAYWLGPGRSGILTDALAPIAGGVTYATFGALLARRRPSLIAWLLLEIGAGFAITSFAAGYTLHAYRVTPGSLPAALPVAWLQTWLFGLVFPVGFSLLLLLFPDGRAVSRTWWAVVWIGIAAAAINTLLAMLADRPLMLQFAAEAPNVPLPVRNPTGVLPRGLSEAVGNAGWIVSTLVLLLSGVSLALRYRRSSGPERLQLKWLAYAGLLVAIGGLNLLTPEDAQGWQPLQQIGFGLMAAGLIVGIPVAAGIAILRYRLYDIDLVINKTLVYAVLAVFIGAVYVGIVVGLGHLLGSAGRPNLALSILATAVVAVAFQPVRERVQRLANRLVFGQKATPYEVLARFSEQAAFSGVEVLPRIAQVVAEGTGAARASLLLSRNGSAEAVASWPPQAAPGAGPERRWPVRYQGEQLGELAIEKPAGEPLSGVEAGLLNDLAAQAGLVLHNLRLGAELQARLAEISRQAAELKESRQRIVAAQDAERRKLERNIHDGAQQHLVALAVKLRLAATLAGRQPERAGQMLAELRQETAVALATLRDLARGIYPPLLREQGLVAALESQTPLEADGVGRYDPEVEAAVYFCCLEALQNVAKYAPEAPLRVRLAEREGRLEFSVEDEGPGFDPEHVSAGAGLRNMRDRIAAAGGELEVISAPGQGTTVRGRLPGRPAQPAA